MVKAHVAIAGYGEVPVGRYPDRPSLEVAIDVSRQAVASAGLELQNVDAVLTAPAFADRDFNTNLSFGRLADELGLRGHAHIVAQVNAGGSTGDRMLRMARGLIQTGQADTVLCVHTDKFSEISMAEILQFFASAGFDAEFEAPYGLTYNSIPSLLARRYMYETGTTQEQLAAVASSLLEWASINPLAKAYGKPKTVEEVLDTTLVQWPFHAAMIPPPADGGSAFVVTSAERAATLREHPAYLIADASRFNTFAFTQHDDITRMHWAEVGRRAYEEAGVGPEDVDVAELYMAYPIFQLVLLEELGFCERGEAGAFALEGNLRPGGKLPVMTNGGAIGHGHTGSGVGVATLVEVARQLAGEAGDRQVPDARVILEASAGGSYMDANVAIFTNELDA